jgi:hypothetical protein
VLENSETIDLAPVIERTYATYREYVVHEDELVNQRLTLLIASQSILLAAFGYVLQKMVDSMPPFKDMPTGSNCLLLQEYQTGVIYWLVLFVISGFVLAAFSFMSILAAKNAIGALKERWEVVASRLDAQSVSVSSVVDEASSSKVAEWEHAYLPALTGGGARKAHEWGLHMPHWLPIFFMVLWLFVTILTVTLGMQRGLMECAAVAGPSTGSFHDGGL